MLIAEYIAQQGGSESVLANIRRLPYWWPLSMAAKSGKDILHVCERLGLTTVEEVQAWIGSCNSGLIPQRESWQRLVSSPASITTLPSIAWQALDDARFAQCNSGADFQRMNSDATYLIPTEAQLRTIAKECPSWRHKHSGTENGDCDDFVNIARGWLSANKLGNLAAGKVGMRLYRQGQLIGGHALLLAFTRESEASPVVAWWLEPQDGNVYPVTYTNLGGFLPWEKPDKVELAWADF